MPIGPCRSGWRKVPGALSFGQKKTRPDACIATELSWNWFSKNDTKQYIDPKGYAFCVENMH